MTSPQTTFDVAQVTQAASAHGESAADIDKDVTALGGEVDQMYSSSKSDMTQAVHDVYHNQFVPAMKKVTTDLNGMAEDMKSVVNQQQSAGEGATQGVTSTGSTMGDFLHPSSA